MMKNIAVNYNSDKPMYQQLYDQISSQILSKTLVPDTQLPSIRKISKELRVSIITIKKTWDLLEQNGLVYSISGKGVFVSQNSDSYLSTKKSKHIEKQIIDLIESSKALEIDETDLLELIKIHYNK